jgi:hypothetical protein
MTNLVDDSSVTKPLIRALRGHVDAFAESMAAELPGGGWRQTRIDAVRPAAVAWVYTTVLVAWAEDHDLVDPWLRPDAEIRRKEFLAVPGMTMSAWVARAIASLCVHPATACLLDPRYNPLRSGTPPEQVIRDLADWWAGDAPSLAYEHDGPGPASIAGWLPGDMLQALSDERRKGFALAQSPWWLADGILDLTLLPAAAEFRDETLKTVDPCCGTGHFLIRMIGYLWELYTTGSLKPGQMVVQSVTGWTPVAPAEAIRRILAGVDGCEIDPLTAAVARLRVVVAIGDLMHRSGLIKGPLRLDAIPPFQPRVVVGDSLLAGKVTAAEYAEIHPRLAEIVNLGTPEPAPPEQTDEQAAVG